MRKALVMAVIGVMVSGGAAFAGDPDIGCGWGTLAFKGNSGVLYKVVAATTNGSFGNQTFGISSGTAGCGRGGVIKAEAATRVYASANIDTLAGDMAAGQGESLDTLAHLMGIAPADRPAFNQLVQSHFGELFASDQVTANEMLGTLRGLMATDAQLAKYAS